jgi:type IV pilus assembly protein PilX
MRDLVSMRSRATANRAHRRGQRGMSILLVLVVMVAALLGGLALARVSETGALVAAGVADKDAALHASEIGVNAAYARVLALAADDADADGWYFSAMRAAGADGTPAGIDWSAAPEISAGRFSVRYVVERLCTVAVATDPARQCVLAPAQPMQSAKAGSEALDVPAGKQYRITVRVTGPRMTLTVVQTLVTQGT